MKNYMIRAELKQQTELRPFALLISGSRDSEVNIDGLPDYRMNESADVESNSSLLRGGKINSVLLVHETPMRFILQYI